ncbi:MAG: mannosyltransferase family protein [Chloroflexota bacterium]
MSPSRSLLTDPAVRQAILLAVLLRVLLAVWAVVVLALRPLPAEPDETLRPYLGIPPLTNGPGSYLLAPWQRFDTLHYLRIANEGYAAVADSVFPPLYPLSMRILDFGFWILDPTCHVPLATCDLPITTLHLLVGLAVSSLALLGAVILLYRLTEVELGSLAASRAALYLALFPTGFFLLAAYSESLFLLLALGALWAARLGRPWLAGLLGLLATLTRLTGVGLVAPLAWQVASGKWQMAGGRWQVASGIQNPKSKIQNSLTLLPPLLPVLGLAGFLTWRAAAGLPPIGDVYRHYWHQTAGWPGLDIVRVVSLLFTGNATRSQFTLLFDLFCVALLLVTTWLAFRRLGVTYGLYMAVMLLFILLPTSELKPFYSFSRYTLIFFPTFMLMGAAGGRRPWLHRLILYPSLALYLYFSGQFFLWGWVA